MNKQIKQFERESGIDVYALGLDKVKWESRLEKFAELIVRECAGIVDNKIEVSRYIHEAELLRECSTTIKQHFGIKQ